MCVRPFNLPRQTFVEKKTSSFLPGPPFPLFAYFCVTSPFPFSGKQVGIHVALITFIKVKENLDAAVSMTTL